MAKLFKVFAAGGRDQARGLLGETSRRLQHSTQARPSWPCSEGGRAAGLRSLLAITFASLTPPPRRVKIGVFRPTNQRAAAFSLISFLGSLINTPHFAIFFFILTETLLIKISAAPMALGAAVAPGETLSINQ